MTSGTAASVGRINYYQVTCEVLALVSAFLKVSGVLHFFLMSRRSSDSISLTLSKHVLPSIFIVDGVCSG